jgi:hypothetical protein
MAETMEDVNRLAGIGLEVIDLKSSIKSFGN